MFKKIIDTVNAAFHDAIGLHGIAEDIRNPVSEKEVEDKLRLYIRHKIDKTLEEKFQEE